MKGRCGHVAGIDVILRRIIARQSILHIELQVLRIGIEWLRIKGDYFSFGEDGNEWDKKLVGKIVF